MRRVGPWGRAARVLAAALGLAVAGLLAVVLWLSTDSGSRWLGRKILDEVNTRFQGTLEAGEIEYRGAGRVTAKAVRSLGPDGAVAATAERLTAMIDVRALLDGRLELTVLRAEGLTAELYPGPNGAYPIAEAFRPRGASGGGSWGFRRVFATVNHLEYGPSRDEPPTLVVESALVRGSLAVGPGLYAFSAEARALLSAPVPGLAEARVVARFRDGRLELDELRATLPGGIEVEGAQAGSAFGAARLVAATPVVPPAPSPGPAESIDVEVEIPRQGLRPYGGPELAGPVRLSAQLRGQGKRISFGATATPSGPGSILADGWFERGEPGSFEVLLDLRGVDPASLLESLPAGRVRLAIEASGSLAFPPHAALRGRARLSGSQLRGAPLGPGRAQFALKGERFSFSGLRLQLPGAELTGGGAVGGEAPLEAGLLLEVDDAAALAQAAREAGLGTPALAGTLHAELDAGELGGRQRLRLTARSPSLAIAGTRLRALGLEASLAGDQLQLELEARLAPGAFAVDLAARRSGPGAARIEALGLRLPGSRWRLASPARLTWGSEAVELSGLALSGPGKLELDLRMPDPRGGRGGPLAGRLRLAEFALAVLGPPLTGLELRGAASGDLELTGSIADPRLAGRLSVSGLGFEGERLGDLRATFALAREALELRGTLRVEQSTPVAVEAELQSRRAAPLWTSEGLRTARGEVRARLDGFELGALGRFGLGDLRGTANGEVALELPFDEPSLRARLELSGVERARLSLPPLDAHLALDSDPRGLSATLDGRLRGFPSFESHARLGASPRALLSGEPLGDAPLEGQLSLGPGPVAYERESLTAASLQASASFSGTAGEPVASLEARVEGLAYRGRVAGELALEATVDPEEIRGELRLEASEGGSLRAEGEYTFASEAWSAKLTASRASVDLLELLPQVETVEGSELDGQLEVSGGKEQVRFGGSLTARASLVALPDYGRTREVRVVLDTDGSSLTLRELAFEAAGGRVSASGSLGWRDGDWTLRLSAALDGFPVPTALAPSAALTTRLEARIAETAGRVQGEVRLSDGEVRFPEAPGGRDLHPVELPAQIVVHEPRELPRQGPTSLEEWLAERRTSIRLSVPRDFFVRSPTASAEVTAELTADWSRATLALLGLAEAQRGEVTLATRRFEIRRFEARFTGAPRIDPALDGLLGYSTREADVEVLVGGTLRAPTVEFRSDPPLDPAQIAMLVTAGSRDGGQTVNPEQLALAGALNLVAGELRDALATALPIDVLEVELGPRGEAQRLEAGTYVSRKLFLAFLRNLFPPPGANFNEVLAELQLSRTLSLRARYGDRQSGSLELFWERGFRSERQRAGQGTDTESTPSLPARVPVD